MDQNTLIFAVIAAAFAVGLFVVVVRLFMSVRQLHASFAKLGYVAREDAKKYFGDAADKVVDMNSGFDARYQALIESAMKKAMADSSAMVQATLVKAEQEATNVVIKAQEEASRIVAEAKTEVGHFSDRTLNEAVDAISWSLKEYIHTDLSVTEHEAIIMQLIEKYVNERRG